MRMFHRFIILCLSAVLVSAEIGCPYPEDVKPCTCTGIYEWDIVLTCIKVHDTQALLRVFENSRRFHFREFKLTESSLQYIPHQIFDDVNVKDFIMSNVTLRNLFDEVPRDSGILRIDATRVKILGGLDWKKLAAFKNLEELKIKDVSLKKLTADFRSNVSKKINHLRFNNCKIKKLQDDEFAEFNDLEYIEMSNNAIGDIKRTMFTRRSKLFLIDMEFNKISTLPKDMFSDMPFLKKIELRGNMIAVLPEDTFQPIISELYYLGVRGNPIKCDCRIAWLLKEKRGKIYGNCYAPKALRDKPFYELTRKDIRC